MHQHVQGRLIKDFTRGPTWSSYLKLPKASGSDGPTPRFLLALAFHSPRQHVQVLACAQKEDKPVSHDEEQHANSSGAKESSQSNKSAQAATRSSDTESLGGSRSQPAALSSNEPSAIPSQKRASFALAFESLDWDGVIDQSRSKRWKWSPEGLANPEDPEDAAAAEKRLKAAKGLSSLIIKAQTVENVLAIWEENSSSCNIVNVAIAFHRIARLMGGMKKDKREAVRLDSRLKKLSERLDSVAHELDGQSVRTVAWAQQRQAIGSSRLPELLLQRFESLMPELRRGQLGGIMLSLLALRQIKKRTLERLNNGIIKWLTARLSRPEHWEQMKLRDVADTLWSYAILGAPNPSVTVLLSKLAKQTFPRPDPSDLQLINVARLAWGFSRVNHQDVALYDGLARNTMLALQKSENSLERQEEKLSTYSRLLWGLARGFSHSATSRQKAEERFWKDDLGQNDSLRAEYLSALPVRKEAVEALCQKLFEGLKSAKWGDVWMEIGMVFQSLSYMKIYDRALIQVMDSWVLENYFELNMQSVANVLWSHGQLRHDSPSVREVLAKQARDLLKAGTDHLSEQAGNAFIGANCKLGVEGLPENRKLVAASARWFIRNEGDVNPHRNIPVVIQGLAYIGIPADDYLIEAYEQIASMLYTWELNKVRLYEADCIFSIMQPGWMGDNDVAPQVWGFRLEAEKSWLRYQREAFALVQETAAEITRMLENMQMNPGMLQPHGGYLLDISLPRERIAIQVLDDSSVARNTLRPLGFKRVKQTVLEQQNWHVINISTAEWKELQSDEEKQRLLNTALESLGCVAAT